MRNLQPSTLRIGHRYRPSRLNGPYDALVIGSGTGGLTTAALLAEFGWRVAVLEQHYTAGGEVFTYARVREILVRNGRACGVRMDDGHEIESRCVISDAGAVNTFTRLLPGEVTRSHGYDGTLAKFEADPSGPFPAVYISFPSAKDPDFERRHPGRATIEIVAPAPWEIFAPWADKTGASAARTTRRSSSRTASGCSSTSTTRCRRCAAASATGRSRRRDLDRRPAPDGTSEETRVRLSRAALRARARAGRAGRPRWAGTRNRHRSAAA
jgi:glycine/D-amino acid oxidase-like deaminating enzyme